MTMMQDLVLPKSALPETPELETSTKLPVEHPAPRLWSRYMLAGENNVGLGQGMPYISLLTALFEGS